jgi:hypothetical protein
MSQDEAQTTASDVTISELLGAVKGFLMDSALPALSGRDQFNARVAANVLGIIDREQQLGPGACGAGRRRRTAMAPG